MRISDWSSDVGSSDLPIMYRTIATHPTTRQIYAKRLVDEKVLTDDEAEGMVTDFQNLLEGELEASKSFKPNKADWLAGKWHGLELASGAARRGTTTVETEHLKNADAALAHAPTGPNTHT